MAAPDLVKSLNNRGRVYVKLGKMEQAEVDASEVQLVSGPVFGSAASTGGERHLPGVCTCT